MVVDDQPAISVFDVREAVARRQALACRPTPALVLWAHAMPKREPQSYTQWEILLWDIDLQKAKSLGVVDAITYCTSRMRSKEKG